MKFILSFFFIITILSLIQLSEQTCIQRKNAHDAIELNKKFEQMTPNDSCTDGDVACINSQFAKCDHGAYVLFPCAPTLKCFALPLVNKRGVSITCGKYYLLLSVMY